MDKQAAQDDVLDGIMGRTLEKQEMIDALTEAVGDKTRAASDRVKVAKDVIDELKAKLKEEVKAKAKMEKEAAKAKKEKVARLLREDAQDERADTKAWEQEMQGKIFAALGIKKQTASLKRKLAVVVAEMESHVRLEERSRHL